MESTTHVDKLKRVITFRLSHTIRSSVASLMGLADVLDRTSLSDENRILIDHLNERCRKLDVDLHQLMIEVESFDASHGQ